MRFRIDPTEVGRRLDAVVADRAGVSRARARALFQERAVRVDGRIARKGEPARAGSDVALERLPPDDEALHPLPDPVVAGALDLLYLDEDVLALAKPPDMPSHPLGPGEPGTAANGIVARWPECARAGGDPREAGLVNRLDIGASGVLLAARSSEAWRRLRESFHRGLAEKTYLAVARQRQGAAIPWDARTIAVPLAHHPTDPRRVVAVEDPAEAVRLAARPAETSLRILGADDRWVVIEARTHTGRMHQVRVHCAHAGVPLYGDTLYGGATIEPGAPLVGFALHAARLHIPHPREGVLDVACPPPPELRALIERAGVAPGLTPGAPDRSR